MKHESCLTKKSSDTDLKRYFCALQKLNESNQEFPVNLDEVWMLVYSRKDKAVRALLEDEQFIQDVDYQVFHQNGENPKGGRPTEIYYLSLSCLEYFIVRKVRKVFEVYRQVFHSVTNNSFQVPQSFSEALLLAAKQQQEIEAKQKQIEAQSRAIERKNSEIIQLSSAVGEMQPKVSYVDMVLQCKETVTTTQIAQDYGKSAKAFNVLLRNYNIQHKVNGQWILYSKYLSRGYVQSDTISIMHSNGMPGTVMHTKWTQKGRLFLYEELKKKGVLPLIESSLYTQK